jgi:hypothetical protein
MADFSIDRYKADFSNLARQYLFFVILNFPNNDGFTNEIGYYVKSTELPSSDYEQMSAYFLGQEYKFAGAQKYANWTVTFNVDDSAKLIKRFQDWRNLIHNNSNNDYGTPKDYMRDQTIQLIGMETMTPICVYTIHGAYPVEVGSIALDYTANEMASVEITFTFQYYTVKQLTAEERVLTPLSQEEKQAMFVPAR